MLALGSALQAQTVFTSDLESWTGNVPNGWVGAKTNLPQQDITQSNTNPHGGLLAVRLNNDTSSHRRFTTVQQTVVAGTAYTISFWVRGQGEVRTGLFDGRPGGSSGYSPYNGYTTVSSNTWQQVTQTVSCTNDTVGAEFIISVRNTIAPDHLLIDDVNIEVAGAPSPSSIYSVQFTADPNGASPVANQGVITGGRVTGVVPSGTAKGYYLQAGTGGWSGIYVLDPTNTVNRGDSVTLGATVEESFGYTRLTNVTNFTIVSTGNPDPAITDVTTAQANTEPYEGVLSKVTNVPCVVAPNNFGEWKLFNGDSLMVDDQMYAYPAMVGTSYSVTGCMFYSFGKYKIEPRDLNDVEVANSIADNAYFANVTVGPVPANEVLYISVGELASDRVEYMLTDLQGRSIANGTFTSDRNIINVSGLNTGSYVLTLRTTEATRSTIVMVLR
jgi:hypothetical protein